MAKHRKSRDQKRKEKKAKKAGKSRRGELLAYSGDKYKTDDLAQLWFETEIAIYEVYVMTDRKLLDRTVYSAVETLVKKLRAGTLPPFVESEEPIYDAGREGDLQHEVDALIYIIRSRWQAYFDKELYKSAWCPSESDCIGVLRSVLGMIESKKVREPQSQRYLKYIAEFLTKQAGVSVDLVRDDETEEVTQSPTLGNLRPAER